jgi:hypothetical protein
MGVAAYQMPAMPTTLESLEIREAGRTLADEASDRCQDRLVIEGLLIGDLGLV